MIKFKKFLILAIVVGVIGIIIGGISIWLAANNLLQS
jgi:hypothetical protein